MALLSRHRFVERLLSVGSVGVLVAIVAAINETFRANLAGVLSGESSYELAMAGGTLQRVVHAAMETVGDHGATQTPLVFFVLVAVALFMLMLRS